MQKYYSSIQSTGSRNSCGGLGRISTHQLSRSDIILITAQIGIRSGWTAEQHAGIELVEGTDGNCYYEREITEIELFDAAVDFLGSDGKLYEVFDQSDENQMAAYRKRCEEFGLEPIMA
jgi:hypothetical protein